MAFKVGIAMAVYAPHPVYFAEQLRSIVAQTHGEWVCAITSDSPIEGILAAADVETLLRDPRFFVSENHERLGHRGNFEAALRAVLSHGPDAIAFSDQDDVWYPEKLATSVRFLREKPALSLVHTDMDLLGPDGVIARDGPSGWETERRGVDHCSAGDLVIRNVVAGCASLLDAELARRHPVIPDAFAYHDHWFAVAAARAGGVYPLHERLYAYRLHGGNVAGITAYRGWLSPRIDGERSFSDAVIGRTRETAERARAAEPVGAPWNFFWRMLFYSRWDLGTGYVLRGVVAAFTSDPALTRACFARAVGKVLATFRFRPKS